MEFGIKSDWYTCSNICESESSFKIHFKGLEKEDEKGEYERVIAEISGGREIIEIF